MIKNIQVEPALSSFARLAKRPSHSTASLDALMSEIFHEVAQKGDNSLLAYTRQFDRVDLTHLRVPPSNIQKAVAAVDIKLKNAIGIAYRNILAFHKAQLTSEIVVETMPGVLCTQKSVPIDRIGLYIPGGTAPLFSTVLMLAIPAVVAGCSDIILCSPPDKSGMIHPAILYTANLCGIREIYSIGGAQAIAAMSIGTESIPKVSKIYGPGNQYVTAAKSYASKYRTAMDMPAGPSELLIYADQTGVPAYIAADLLSQAEHGIDSQVVLVAQSEEIIHKVNAQLEKQLPCLPRADIAAKAINHSLALVLKSTEVAWQYINHYAPEHLIIASEKPEQYVTMVKNAGSVFLGNYSPESVGDYASGTNHTLPTDGWAHSYSGINVDAFMKKITFQKLSREGLATLGDTVVTMAESESLSAHARAINIRLTDNK